MTGIAGMTKEELRTTIREVVHDEIRGIVRTAMEDAMKVAMEETFLRMGLAADDPLEAQRDFQHLRSWRKSTESLGAKALATAIGIMVTGGLAALWLGIMGPRH